jgi:ABC-type sugar transport system permease subunit
MSIVIMIATGLASLFLIIPSIIVSVWVSFAAYVLVLENNEIIASIKKSREYVRGRWWDVFRRFGAGILMIIVLSIVVTLPLSLLNESVANLVFTVLSVFFAPLRVSYAYFMYQDVKQEANEITNNSESQESSGSQK